MDDTLNNDDGSWDIAPPNTPLRMEWPSLERSPEAPLKFKKFNGWKKYRKNGKERKQELDQSLIASPEEQMKIMQVRFV
jgi:hypothetical protein